MLRTRREAGLDFSFCHGRNKAPYCSGKSHFPTACGGHRWGAYLHCLAFCLDTSRNRSWEIRGFYFIPIPKKDNAKESSNYCTIALISHASKVMQSLKNRENRARHWSCGTQEQAMNNFPVFIQVLLYMTCPGKLKKKKLWLAICLLLGMWVELFW